MSRRSRSSAFRSVGLGELSKVLLIVYTAFFVTSHRDPAGAMAVEGEGGFLGASLLQVFWHVIVPATMLAAITGTAWPSATPS